MFATQVGEPACAVRVIHNGISPEELQPVPPNGDAADFVFVGELRMLKGVDLLIEATARLVAERPCRVAIVGAGPDAETFRSEVAERGLTTAIDFAGALPARQAFRLGRVLVMPSRAESLPYVALEAAGAGLPLIATDVGGMREIMLGTDTPLIKPNDPETLAAAMRDHLDDPDRARDRAQRLRLSLSRGFSVSAMAEGILAFYEDAARHRLPSPASGPEHQAHEAA